MQRYQREHFWNAIVWPLLWPLLLLQAALVVLCLVVGALVWWMSPKCLILSFRVTLESDISNGWNHVKAFRCSPY